jgi:hypothetical protein
MPTYNFTDQGIAQLYADYLNGSTGPGFVDDIENDLRQFIKDNFNLNQDQSDYIDDIPDELFSIIGKNLAHALTNSYSISVRINEFSQAFFDGSGNALATPPTWGTTRLDCKIGHWTTHHSGCHEEHHYGIKCTLWF